MKLPSRFSIALLASLLGAHAAVADQPNAQLALVQGNTEFALKLYAQLAGDKGNLFFSPYSISSALAMTYDGARNKTAAEMKQVLHFPFASEQLNPAFAELARALQSDDKSKFKLVVANRLFGQKDYGFLPKFLADQREFYGAPLEEVDFIKATEEARQTINRWAEKQTNDKIKDLIQPGVIGADARLVLANAIYFKAAWNTPFYVKATSDDDFFTAPGQSVKTPTMHTSDRAGYWSSDALSVLDLPYENRQLSMVILLPGKIDGLAVLEKNLTAANLKTWLETLSAHQVRISLPKFKQTAQFQLNKALGDMGMTDAFSKQADFSGMSSHDNLAISAVVHKAFVDVNEAGTEAAAATAVGIRVTSAPVTKVVTFKADHPFIYVIRDNRTGALLFMGRVVTLGEPGT
jgi:serpin B